jgi:hypothetical protein
LETKSVRVKVILLVLSSVLSSDYKSDRPTSATLWAMELVPLSVLVKETWSVLQ